MRAVDANGRDAVRIGPVLRIPARRPSPSPSPSCMASCAKRDLHARDGIRSRTPAFIE